MQLTAEQFREVLSAVRGDKTRRDEKRNMPRVALRTRVQVVILHATDGPMKPQQFWIRDFSQTGIGLLSSARVVAGTHMVICLPSSSRQPICILAQVVRSQQVPGNLHIIGSRFIQHVDEADLKSALSGKPEALLQYITPGAAA